MDTGSTMRKNKAVFFHRTAPEHVIAADFFSLGRSMEAENISAEHIKIEALQSPEYVQALVQRKDIAFLYTHNLAGLNVRIGGHYFYDLMDAPIISVIDTPYNKYNALVDTGANKIYNLGDMQHASFIRSIDPGQEDYIQCRHSPSASSDLPPPMPFGQRKIDLLFAGRLTLGTPVSGNFITEAEFTSIIEMLRPEYSHQPHDLEDRIRQCLSAASLERIHNDPQRWWRTIWNITRIIRVERRLEQLRSLAGLTEQFRVAAVVDDVEVARKILGPRAQVVSFLPWPAFVSLLGISKCLVTTEPFHIHGIHEKTLTAMNLATAVFTDSNVFLKDHLKNGENIFLIEPGNNGLVEMIGDAFSDEANLERVGTNGRDYVLENHNDGKSVEIILNALKKRERQCTA